MTRRALLVAAILALASVGQVPAQERENARVTLWIEGMHCGACAERIEDVLGRLPGVISADVDFEQTRALVVYQPGRVTVARVVSAVEEAGFRARPS